MLGLLKGNSTRYMQAAVYIGSNSIRLVVFDRSALTALAIALLLPVTPLVLTMFSVDELMNKLVSILL